MLKKLAAVVALTLLSTGVATAGSGDPMAIGDIANGTACKMSFQVKELRTPVIAGAPLGSAPDDVYLKLLAVDDKTNPLCQRALNARLITMNGAANQLTNVAFAPGDRLTATVLYQALMHGKMTYDEYHHVMVIEKGVGAPGVYHGLGLIR